MINYILLTTDSNSSSVLLLLDVSVTFDTANHGILLDHLKNQFGVSGLALAGLKSYPSERTQCVSYNNITSFISDVKNGVLQGSVLGPLLFSLYISPSGQTILSFGINFHCYADDTQLYVSVRADDHALSF